MDRGKKGEKTEIVVSCGDGLRLKRMWQCGRGLTVGHHKAAENVRGADVIAIAGRNVEVSTKVGRRVAQGTNEFGFICRYASRCCNLVGLHRAQHFKSQ